MQTIHPDSATINIGEALGRLSIIEVTSWKKGISWILHEIKNIQQEYPVWDLPKFSLGFLEKAFDESGVQFDIPQDVSNAIKRFEEQFYDHYSAALWFVSRSYEAKQLLMDMPFIFWCVLEHAQKNELDADEVFALFCEKRSHILKLVGLSGTKSQIKVLRHIHFSKLFESNHLQQLITFFERFTPQQIGRLQYLDTNLVTQLNNDPTLIKNKWINCLNAESASRIKSYIELGHDTARMMRVLNEEHKLGLIRRCKTTDELNQLHERYIDHLNQQKFDKMNNTCFPNSPLEDVDNIKYIATAKELHQEGLSQRHCVYSYLNRIVMGEYLIYQYCGKQRATIGISFRNGQYKIDQIKAKCNGIVDEETKSEIQNWFFQVCPKN